MVVFDSQGIIDFHVTETISNIAKIWEEQVEAFLRNQLVSKKKILYDRFKPNNLLIVNIPERYEAKLKKNQITTMKKSCQLLPSCTSLANCAIVT